MGAGGTAKIDDKTQLKDFFEVFPTNEPYVLEEFVPSSGIAAYDAILDSRGEPLFENQEEFPPSMSELAHRQLDLAYWSRPSVDPRLQHLGRATAKSFGLESRFVHMVLPDGTLTTGKTSELLGAASSLLLNALKAVAGVDKDTYVVSDEALVPIGHLKTEYLHSHNPRLHSDETLIALSISSATNPEADRVIAATSDLAGCDAYFSVIISPTDENAYRRLGINVCCEPKFERGSFYHR